jgi:hypothetical protein
LNSTQILSRRSDDRKVNFAPDTARGSPYDQLRRLSALLKANTLGPDDITDCEDAINAWRELLYRKIFTGTSHEQYVRLDETEPEAIDWLISVHSIDAEAYRNNRQSK